MSLRGPCPGGPGHWDTSGEMSESSGGVPETETTEHHPDIEANTLWETSGVVEECPALSPAVRSLESEAVSYSALGPCAATAGSLGPPLRPVPWPMPAG